ncbi:MAG: DJ-1/PfpI family protein [Myxococcales bacterium]|nr:DJ-1/PfpI family protein [Myxococcales bacterium]
MSAARVLVPLTHGVDVVQALTAVDLLRRAGVQVVTASVASTNPIIGARRIRVLADLDLNDAIAEWGDDFDLILLPGGDAPGLLESPALLALVAAIRAGTGKAGAFIAGGRSAAVLVARAAPAREPPSTLTGLLVGRRGEALIHVPTPNAEAPLGVTGARLAEQALMLLGLAAAPNP